MSEYTWRARAGRDRLKPYEEPTRSVAERVADLVPRLSVDELAGLMFHTVIETGKGGEILEGPGAISKSGTREVVVDKRMNHFNVHGLESARSAALWANRVQALAQETPHAIPVTISTDPRHSAAQNAGAAWATPFFSLWPDPLGLAALADEELIEQYYDIVRREYVAVGIRAALHPTADLATEPRWARQSETLGQDPARTAQWITAALRGLRGPVLGSESVAATTKHFPGAGPQAGGEDAHFPYGREQAYPGGRFDDHLTPFLAAIAEGTSAIMPYYGMPRGLVVDGMAIEEVGFAYNRQIITELLRGRLGYDGVVLSDWELINDNHVGDQVLPARAWGVERLSPAERMLRLLDAGIDQFGGEECTELLLDLHAGGRVSRERLEASAARLLRVKFELGLFDDPFIDVDAAPQVVGSADAVALGLRTQARSLVVATNPVGALPLRDRPRAYLEGIDAEVAAHYADVVSRPEDADICLVRVGAPFEPRSDLFLETWFHQGSLDFPPGLAHRLARLRRHAPLVIDVMADRPAVCTPLVEVSDALTISFGVSDAAWLLAITGTVAPEGRLPIQFPASMAQVRGSREDVPGDIDAPLFEAGHGLTLSPR